MSVRELGVVGGVCLEMLEVPAMPIKLYDLVGRDPTRPYSPHCWKSAFALAHKGLAFERVPTRFTDVPAVESGVSTTVPVICDGDRIVADSFNIALYLEDAYPDRPSLFKGDGGKTIARFLDRWSYLVLQPYVGKLAQMDIYNIQDRDNAAYYRQSRELRYGMTFEEVAANREANLLAFRTALEPIRNTLDYQPFIGGEGPLFADYIIAGYFQLLRVTSQFKFLEEGDPVGFWFERCLDLNGGMARQIAAAS